MSLLEDVAETSFNTKLFSFGFLTSSSFHCQVSNVQNPLSNVCTLHKPRASGIAYPYQNVQCTQCIYIIAIYFNSNHILISTIEGDCEINRNNCVLS